MDGFLGDFWAPVDRADQSGIRWQRGRTPPTHSCSQVDALVQLPIDPDAAADDEGITLLMRASENGHLDVAHLLLEADAEKDVRDNDGCTAMMSAACGGSAPVVQLLLNGQHSTDGCSMSRSCCSCAAAVGRRR